MKLPAPDEAVARAAQVLPRYPAIHRVVESQFESRVLRPTARHGIEALLSEHLVSLFSALLAVEMTEEYNPEASAPFERMLSTLDRYLSDFANSEGVSRFLEPLLNVEGSSFLSLLSELSLAHHFYRTGWDVSFRVPFRVDERGGRKAERDCDLVIQKENARVILEVYSPVQPLAVGDSGFLSMQPDGLLDKVVKKLQKKFGPPGSTVRGLPSGPVLLAVNVPSVPI